MVTTKDVQRNYEKSFPRSFNVDVITTFILENLVRHQDWFKPVPASFDTKRIDLTGCPKYDNHI